MDGRGVSWHQSIEFASVKDSDKLPVIRLDIPEIADVAITRDGAPFQYARFAQENLLIQRLEDSQPSNRRRQVARLAHRHRGSHQ